MFLVMAEDGIGEWYRELFIQVERSLCFPFCTDCIIIIGFETMSKYLLPILALIIGAILKPTGNYLLAVILFQFGDLRRRQIKGRWRSQWSFDDPGENEPHEEIVTFRHFGPFIKGTAVSAKNQYSIKAKLNPDGYLHGTWRETREDVDWYGSIKLRLSGNGRSMKGKWIGKGRLGVRAGDWQFEKLD